MNLILSPNRVDVEEENFFTASVGFQFGGAVSYQLTKRLQLSLGTQFKDNRLKIYRESRHYFLPGAEIKLETRTMPFTFVGCHERIKIGEIYNTDYSFHYTNSFIQTPLVASYVIFQRLRLRLGIEPQFVFNRRLNTNRLNFSVDSNNLDHRICTDRVESVEEKHIAWYRINESVYQHPLELNLIGGLEMQVYQHL